MLEILRKTSHGAEGGIQKNAKKVNDLGAVGVQNREKRVRSRTLYAPNSPQGGIGYNCTLHLDIRHKFQDGIFKNKHSFLVQSHNIFS